jgi:WD40 repeat protein
MRVARAFAILTAFTFVVISFAGESQGDSKPIVIDGANPQLRGKTGRQWVMVFSPGLGFSPDGQVLATTSQQGGSKLLDAKTLKVIAELSP